MSAVLPPRMARPAWGCEEGLLGRPWLSGVPGMAVRDESRTLPGFQAQEGAGVGVDMITVAGTVHTRGLHAVRGLTPRRLLKMQSAVCWRGLGALGHWQSLKPRGTFIQFVFVLMSVCGAWLCLISLVSCHPLPFLPGPSPLCFFSAPPPLSGFPTSPGAGAELQTRRSASEMSAGCSSLLQSWGLLLMSLGDGGPGRLLESRGREEEGGRAAMSHLALDGEPQRAQLGLPEQTQELCLRAT